LTRISEIESNHTSVKSGNDNSPELGGQTGILQNVQDKSADFPFTRVILHKVQQIPGGAAQAGDYPAFFAT
jgi:hypothetical protein